MGGTRQGGTLDIVHKDMNVVFMYAYIAGTCGVCVAGGCAIFSVPIGCD